MREGVVLVPHVGDGRPSVRWSGGSSGGRSVRACVPLSRPLTGVARSV
jgi:hypothetical protein